MKNLVFFQFLILIIFYQNAWTQNKLVGKTRDGNTDAHLPFVNIIINDGEVSTISDLEGNFELSTANKINKVTFKKSGYYQLDYKITFGKDREPLKRFLNIKLFKTTKDSIKRKDIYYLGNLQTRQLVDSFLYYRQKNDFQYLKTYSYQKYQKSHVTLHNLDKIKFYGDSLRKIWTDSTQKKKIRKQTLKTHKNLFYFLDYYLFLEEFASKNYFIKPNYKQEKIEAYRQVGFQTPNLLSSFLQQKPLNFYQDKVRICNKEFINPFSTLGAEYYRFSINDTLLAKNSNWVLIEFVPTSDNNLNLLKGFAYLGLEDFALQSLDVELLEQKQKAHIKIKQHYNKVDNKTVPVFLKTTTVFPYKLLDIPIILNQKLQFYNYQFAPEFNKATFKNHSFQLNKNRQDTEEATWLLHRSKIDQISQQTYAHLDTVGKKYKFDRYARIADLLVSKYYPLSNELDLDISQTSLNRHEGFRTGLGISSSPFWSDKYSGNIYLAYGFKDEVLKYGVSGNAKVWGKYQIELDFAFRKDVQEPANTNFYNDYYIKSSQIFRDVLTYRMDRIENVVLAVKAIPYHNLEVSLGLSRNFVSPQYNYSYTHNLGQEDEKVYQSFTTTEFVLEAKYKFKRNINQIRLRNYEFNKAYPNIALQYKRGLSGLLGSNFEYHQFLLEADYIQDWMLYGKTNFSIQAGFIDNDLPYSLLFNGRGSFELGYPLSAEKHFEVMPLYQFLNQRFFNIFIEHNFGRLLYFPRNQWFQPKFSIVQNIGFGSFSGEKTAHQYIIFEDMASGYFETGIVAEDLFRISLFKTANLNLGTGFFVRYGRYNSTDGLENIALKLRANIDF